MVQNEDKKYKYLYPKRPESIIYDITHDNETFYKKYNNLGISLTVMACNSFSICPIGSTRGTDQLFPKQPSVVNENRNYLYVNEEIEKNINELENDKSNNNNEKEEEEEKEEKKEEIEKIKKVNFEFKCDAEKVFLALLCAGLFVACGNKNKVVEEPAVDSVVVEEIVEEPVVEEPVVAEEPAPAPAKTTTTTKKNNNKPATTTKTEDQSLKDHAKQTGNNIGNAALEKVETEAVKEINNATPNKRRR